MVGKLAKCIECGSTLSRKATSCPNCRTYSPFGKRCGICSKTVKISEGKSYDLGEGWGGFYHDDCHKKISGLRYSCPACGAEVRDYRCDKCNEPLKWYRCCYCSMFMRADAEKKVGDDDNDLPVYAHRSCYEARHACFIATAAMGSPLVSDVKVLTEFRDQHLMKTAIGKRLVRLYERISPGAAALISRNRTLQVLARILLIRPASFVASNLLLPLSSLLCLLEDKPGSE
jgi:hypothetical protein